MFINKDPPLHCISQFYKALIKLQSPSYREYLYKWETDLNSQLTDEQRDQILQLAHVSSISSKIAEINYKLLTRWNYTPDKLHCMFHSSSPLFWRTCGNTAFHVHIC